MKSLDRYSGMGLNEVDIAQRAHEFRQKIGVADRAYINIVEILEFDVAKFIPEFRLMVRRDIELDVTAVTTFDPPRILVRETIYDAACDGDPDCRRILAHELGHLLLHRSFEGSMQQDYQGYSAQFPNMTSLESTEDQADIFARNLLVPPYIAFESRHNIDELARKTGAPGYVAAAAATISRRRELIKLRQIPSHGNPRSRRA
jgi:Zn-dependent peptidase ImmA (M78 family)